MEEDLIRQLNLRIEEHQQYLREQLDDLQDAIQSIHRTLAARLDAHEAYHAANEHRWGLLRLAQRHPIRLSLAAFLTAWLLAAALPESLASLTAILHIVCEILLGR